MTQIYHSSLFLFYSPRPLDWKKVCFKGEPSVIGHTEPNRAYDTVDGHYRSLESVRPLEKEIETIFPQLSQTSLENAYQSTLYPFLLKYTTKKELSFAYIQLRDERAGLRLDFI